MSRNGVLLEISFGASRPQTARRQSRFSAFLEGFARAFDPAPVEPVSHYIRDDASAMRADLQSLSVGLSNRTTTRRMAG